MERERERDGDRERKKERERRRDREESSSQLEKKYREKVFERKFLSIEFLFQSKCSFHVMEISINDLKQLSATTPNP